MFCRNILFVNNGKDDILKRNILHKLYLIILRANLHHWQTWKAYCASIK